MDNKGPYRQHMINPRMHKKDNPMTYRKGTNSNRNQEPVYLVISDSSQLIEKQDFDPKQNLLLVKQPEANEQQGIYMVEQKPIRLKTFQERLNERMIQNKPSKKIKLDEGNKQTAPMIRFNLVKNNGLEQQQVQRSDNTLKQRQQLKKAVPWMSKQTRQIEDVCLRFHNEVVQFYDYIRPTKKQHQNRLRVLSLVKKMILQKYPYAKVQCFGSFATKLYLPDGDIDITVLVDNVDGYEERKIYDNIHRIIRRNDGTIFCDVQYIRNSKVPLIKFVHADTQFQFDITVNKKDGLKQIQHVERMKKIYPEFEPLLFVLKATLKIRNMSQTYTGGIGSFLLVCMTLHFLRYTHKKEYYYSMGQFVMKFMEFYGTGDWDRKSIYVADGTQVGRAREPGTLSFFSPQDDSHDIGKSAYRIRDSFNAFKNRFRAISGKNFKQQESILKQLINPSLEEFRYYRYEKNLNKTTN